MKNKFALVKIEFVMDNPINNLEVLANSYGFHEMNGPSRKYNDYDSVGLTSISIWQLNNHYGDCEIIKDHAYIGMTYQEVKTLLKQI